MLLSWNLQETWFSFTLARDNKVLFFLNLNVLALTKILSQNEMSVDLFYMALEQWMYKYGKDDVKIERKLTDCPSSAASHLLEGESNLSKVT